MAAEFRIANVVNRHLYIPPEEIVLGKYTFLPHHRTGAAAGLRNPFSTASPARATLSMSVPVTSGASTATAATTLLLRGPGDVLSVDPRQVIRRYPEPGIHDAEPSDLAHIEFDAPDLPWQFTPTGPDATGNLPSWLRLIVVRADSARELPPAGPGLPRALAVPKDELPPPDEVWAWAHTQVIGPPTGNPNDPSLAQRLSGASPTTNVSRLICPRHLEAHTSWVAAVVPTFEVGRLAGLGMPVPDDADLAWAWGPASADVVTLPSYDLWRFATGDDGDFETLALRLHPVAPPPGVGRRLLDTSQPGLGIEPLPGGELREVVGPLIRVGDSLTDGRSWPADTTEALRQRVDAPDEVAYAPGEANDPTLGPPIYAGAHLARRTVPPEGAEPAWARSLNLDPVNRVIAGLGTRVAQMDQEELMASAWAQVEGVVAANAALSAAALGRFVSESLHRRHLGRMVAADLITTTARSHSRILDAPEQTVAARIGSSALAPAAVGPLFRRLARPAGPIARFAGPSPVERAAATRALVSGPAGTARSWVRPYVAPDGVRGLNASTATALVEALPELADTLARLQDQLAESAFLATVGDQRVDVFELADGLARDGAADELRRALEALLAALPTREEIQRDPRANGPLVPDLAGQAFAVLDVGARSDRELWSISADVLRRLELSGEPDDDHGGREVVPADELRSVLADLWAIAAELDDLGEHHDPAADRDTIELLLPLIEVDDGLLAGDLSRLRDGLTVQIPALADIPRATLDISELALLERLDPRVTSVRRITARITGWPSWLPGDWFDDTRLERVMVAPKFRHPMYEALDRYDREWLLPGVGDISPQEMVTLLSTNPGFAEAFLIGLNTEMARELLWREYPTDGRATSFRSFWTTNDELLAEVHALGVGALGDHIDPRYASATVLLVRGELVRRYPDVLAHAVRQSSDVGPPKMAATPATTLFRLHLAPDLLLVGVDVKSADVLAADDLDAEPPEGAWWFTLSEHVGQPRFGLDEVAALPRTRDNLAWTDWVPAANPFLRPPSPAFPVADRPRAGADAAMVAWLLFQQPARAAFRGARMIAGMS